MRRIAIAIGLCGLLAACGQQSEPAAEGGTGAPLDYIDAVPITEDAPPPVVEPQAPAKKDEEKDEDRDEPAEEKAAEPAEPAPDRSEPAPTAEDATEATRRANETTTPPEAGQTSPPSN